MKSVGSVGHACMIIFFPDLVIWPCGFSREEIEVANAFSIRSVEEGGGQSFADGVTFRRLGEQLVGFLREFQMFFPFLWEDIVGVFFYFYCKVRPFYLWCTKIGTLHSKTFLILGN